MSTARDEFFRRYATSPIHVPRLERLLAAYGDDEQDDAFSRRFLAWDRACPDAEAARIVAEILSAGDEAGRIVRLSDAGVEGAIRWMSDATSMPVAERASALRDGLRSTRAAELIRFLESAGPLEAARFRATAAALAEALSRGA